MDNFSALLGKKLAGSGGGSGTSNYNDLENKPQINGQTLNGNKTAANLGLQSAINQNNKLDADLLDDSESEKKLVSENDISNWNNKYDSDDAYTKAQTDAGIENAINGLDVAETGGAGQYISAISETNGKISATPKTFDTSLSSSSTDGNAPTSKTVYDSQAAQDAEIAWNVNQGVKNLIELSPNTYTSGNVVVKLNDDGTVSVSLSSGSTANTTFSRAIKTITNLRDMDLILNGCPSGGNYSSGYALYISDDSTTKEKDEGNEVLVPKNTTVTTSYLALIVRSGTAISGTLTFKPMIRPASITDSTFQPYTKTNRELTVAEDEDRAALIEQVDEGAKNLLPITIQTQTVKTVVFTVNSDGTITANGTVTGGDAYLNLETLIGDKYTGNILSGGASNLKICMSKGGSGQIAVYSESSEGVEIPDNATNTLFLFATNGTQLNNVTVKPMICTAADWAVSQKFVPYRPSWQELYEMILALQSGGASTQSVQPALMSAAKPLISAEETSEKEAEPDEVSEIEEKEKVKDETETS